LPPGWARWGSGVRGEVGGAFATTGPFDGVEGGEGARRHQALPGGEVVHGPHVVLGGIESDPTELLCGEPASVEDEPTAVVIWLPS